ncbi:MAG: GNAT family N-acetyltransferase [Candidatus Polarisedimenticolia bacterium]
MNVRDATDAEIGQILEGTHPLWSDGLDPETYERFVRAMTTTSWARSGSYRFLVMPEPGGDLACAMKLYRLEARVEGVSRTFGGVGAVFTFPRHRRQGHAAAMITQAHAWMKQRGDAASLLHSEIGAPYYARLGYRPFEPDAVTLRVPAEGPGSPDRLQVLDPETGDGLDALMALRRHEDATLPFVLERDRGYWEVLLARAGIPGRSLGKDRWESRIVHDPRGGFLWSLLREPGPAAAHDGGAAARIMEFAERSPGALLPGLMDDLFAACRARGLSTVESWRGADLALRAPHLELQSVGPPSVVPMWMPLDEAAAPGIERALRGAPLHLSEVF